jgi:hypothetical protein
MELPQAHLRLKYSVAKRKVFDYMLLRPDQLAEEKHS